MRIYRGRVMHQVEPAGDGWLRSVCTRPNRYLTGKTEPRAYAQIEAWSGERYDYPDCQHCPPDPPAATRTVHPSHDPEPDDARLHPGGRACRRCMWFVTVGVPARVTNRGAAVCVPARIALRTERQP